MLGQTSVKQVTHRDSGEGAKLFLSECRRRVLRPFVKGEEGRRHQASQNNSEIWRSRQFAPGVELPGGWIDQDSLELLEGWVGAMPWGTFKASVHHCFPCTVTSLSFPHGTKWWGWWGPTQGWAAGSGTWTACQGPAKIRICLASAFRSFTYNWLVVLPTLPFSRGNYSTGAKDRKYLECHETPSSYRLGSISHDCKKMVSDFPVALHPETKWAVEDSVYPPLLISWTLQVMAKLSSEEWWVVIGFVLLAQGLILSLSPCFCRSWFSRGAQARSYF